MTRSIPISNLASRIAALPEELLQEPDLGVVAVTRGGQPVLAILPWELYAVMIETLGDGKGTEASAGGAARNRARVSADRVASISSPESKG